MINKFVWFVGAVCLTGGGAAAQHIHIQTSYAPTTGWSLFWYDFEAGAFPAGDFVQPITKAARRQIPDVAVLTNALGMAGNPVWILPEVETAELPSLGLGTQGSGSFLSGQIRLRLATFAGPGHLAIYSLDAFGEPNVFVATRDGLTASDAVPMTFPAGHRHVNWAFTRPGLYQLGWQAEGTLTGGGFTNSSLVAFAFQVVPPAPPILQLSIPNGASHLSVITEGNVPLRIETSTNLTTWELRTNFWSTTPLWQHSESLSLPQRFYRAQHVFP